MPKIILERADVEKLIKDRYPGAEIVSGMSDDDIYIRVPDFQMAPQKAPTRTTTQALATSTPVQAQNSETDEVPEGWYKLANGQLVEIPKEHLPKPEVRTGDGNIDAGASGLTLESKGVPRRAPLKMVTGG